MHASSKEVVIYVTEYCPFCHAAKDLLKSKGVSFKEVDVTNDPEEREQLIQKSGGHLTVPQIFVDGKNIGGYDELVTLYNSGGTI